MVKLLKFTGAGNHFLLVDLRTKNSQIEFQNYFGSRARSKIARDLCDPYKSIGADGLLVLEKSKRADLKWDFYNADGSSAEMCGNAARCVGRYVLTFPPIKRQLSHNTLLNFTLETDAGVIRVRALYKKPLTINKETSVDVEMPKISSYQPHQFVNLNGRKIKFCFVNSGVPHAVVQLSSQMNLSRMQKDVDKLADTVDKIRALATFKKSGTNVTFYSEQSRNLIHSLTFERGVKGYTQACGTGAVAAAICFTNNKKAQVKVKVPGGVLKVRVKRENPILTGPAKFIGEVRLLGETHLAGDPNVY
jgi:diaminopimelate epimerase